MENWLREWKEILGERKIVFLDEHQFGLGIRYSYEFFNFVMKEARDIGVKVEFLSFSSSGFCIDCFDMFLLCLNVNPYDGHSDMNAEYPRSW